MSDEDDSLLSASLNAIHGGIATTFIYPAGDVCFNTRECYICSLVLFQLRRFISYEYKLSSTLNVSFFPETVKTFDVSTEFRVAGSVEHRYGRSK